MTAAAQDRELAVLHVARLVHPVRHGDEAVGVALETMKQVDSQLMMRNYDSFLLK